MKKKEKNKDRKLNLDWVCSHCRHPAHMKADCPTRVCDAAGSMDTCPCSFGDYIMPKSRSMQRRVALQKGQPMPTFVKPSRPQALEAVRTLISYLGDNPDRPGLLKTPERVIRAWETDWGTGYDTLKTVAQEESILGGMFDDGAEDVSEMVCVRGIHYHSSCEHHLAPFFGTVDIAYIPKGKILGLSKLVRVVEMFSRRLQVQERLTSQIANYIQKNCKPIGVGVVVRGVHLCMLSRGVKQFETEAVTSALRGEMLTEPEVRSEFLRLVGR